MKTILILATTIILNSCGTYDEPLFEFRVYSVDVTNSSGVNVKGETRNECPKIQKPKQN